MIARIWHGWTTAANAGEYERLLREEVFPAIEAKRIPGCLGVRLLRRPLDTGEIQFVTIMEFESWDAVRAFAGEDFEAAYVPDAARAVLARFDARSAHYSVLADRRFPQE